MWLMLRRFLWMSVASWALAKAVTRYPRLEGLSRLLGSRRYARPYRGR